MDVFQNRLFKILRLFSYHQTHHLDCVFFGQPNCIAFTAVIIHRELKADLLYDAPAVIPFGIQLDCLDEGSHEFLLFKIRHLSVYLIKFQKKLIDLFSGDLLPAGRGYLRLPHSKASPSVPKSGHTGYPGVPAYPDTSGRNADHSRPAYPA